jgi:hypothetical protein
MAALLRVTLIVGALFSTVSVLSPHVEVDYDQPRSIVLARADKAIKQAYAHDLSGCNRGICIKVTSRGGGHINFISVYVEDASRPKMNQFFVDFYPPGKPAVRMASVVTPAYAAGFAYNTDWPSQTKVCGAANESNGQRTQGYPCVIID